MEMKTTPDVIFKSDCNVNFQLNPREYGIDLKPFGKTDINLNKYEVCEIYREPLAPTSISLGVVPDSNEKVAIKKIFKDLLVTNFMKAQAAQEPPLHCSLRHENIVRGIEWSENKEEYILIMDYTSHADYFKEKIDTNLNFVKNEDKLRYYTSQILEGLNYLHTTGIAHGDIKLENILVDRDEDGIPTVKLCDFGLSRRIDTASNKFYMETPVGSHHYMAPEIKARSYVDEKIDIWALGVVLYKMSVAYKPTQIGKFKYGTDEIPFRAQDWRKRAPDLKDLIKSMLEVNPEKRISAQEALDHPWFQI